MQTLARNDSGVDAEAAVAAASSCVLKCPQCQAWISLFASLAASAAGGLPATASRGAPRDTVPRRLDLPKLVTNYPSSTEDLALAATMAPSPAGPLRLESVQPATATQLHIAASSVHSDNITTLPPAAHPPYDPHNTSGPLLLFRKNTGGSGTDSENKGGSTSDASSTGLMLKRGAAGEEPTRPCSPGTFMSVVNSSGNKASAAPPTEATYTSPLKSASKVSLLAPEHRGPVDTNTAAMTVSKTTQSRMALWAPMAPQHLRVANGHSIRVIPSFRRKVNYPGGGGAGGGSGDLSMHAANTSSNCGIVGVMEAPSNNVSVSALDPALLGAGNSDFMRQIASLDVNHRDITSTSRSFRGGVPASPLTALMRFGMLSAVPPDCRPPLPTSIANSSASDLSPPRAFGRFLSNGSLTSGASPSHGMPPGMTPLYGNNEIVTEAFSEYSHAMRSVPVNPLLPPMASPPTRTIMDSLRPSTHSRRSVVSDDGSGEGSTFLETIPLRLLKKPSNMPPRRPSNRSAVEEDSVPLQGSAAAGENPPTVGPAVGERRVRRQPVKMATSHENASGAGTTQGPSSITIGKAPTSQPSTDSTTHEGDDDDDGGSREDTHNAASDPGIHRRSIAVLVNPVMSLKRLRHAVAHMHALDDAGVLLQCTDVHYVIFSVFLCCLALFLLNGPSRPWLINDTTGALVLIAQVFTLGWTILRYFVRNRDAKSSFVVNDTVGDTSKKYFLTLSFWLDAIVALPVEWMAVPLIRERNKSWWSSVDGGLTPMNSSNSSSTWSPPPTMPSSTASNTDWYGKKSSWETAAAVLSFLMLRHFLRYWRIASLISSSNPIVSERSIFRFLTAVSIAFAVLCTCAVAFQAWEGPTLAPLLVAEASGFGKAGVYASTFAPMDVDAGAVTTPGLFASFDALYWSMTTALTVGYGDITPRTPGGRAIAIITMIVGTALLSTMTAIATSYFANKDPVQQELEERMRKMTSMLEYFEVPWELQRDVIASFPAVMEAHSRAAFLDMIENLPEICRNRVEGYSRLRLLRQIALFEGIAREHAFLLAKCLTQQFVAAQDTVVMQGELGNEMYFIVHGMLDVVVEVPASATKVGEKIVVATLRDGAFFGERGLLHDAPRGASVVAITLTELLVLTRVDFEQVVCRIPEVLEAFRRNVFKQSGGAPPPAPTPSPAVAPVDPPSMQSTTSVEPAPMHPQPRSTSDDMTYDDHTRMPSLALTMHPTASSLGSMQQSPIMIAAQSTDRAGDSYGPAEEDLPTPAVCVTTDGSSAVVSCPE